MFIITTKRLFCIALILASCCRLLAADPNAWEQLNLSSTGIAGATVYYEKSFEPKLPVFEREYKKFLAEKESAKAINAKKNQIFADINQILGISEPDTEKQDKLWTGLLGVFSLEKTTFYIVKQGTTKDFLRADGQLPNFTYDKAGDNATYNPEFKTTSKNGPIKDFEFTFPIDSDETFEKDVSQIFQILQVALGRSKPYLTIHEVVEVSLLMQAKPTDPYWRWFSDGFANAITIEILKKYTGAEDAEEFAEAYDVNKYKKLEKEINLRYWMGLNFCIKTPLEYESELRMARYTYATYEAQRLIEKHGFDCVRKILDEVCTKKTRTGQDILQAIKQVTGDDIQQRLGHYQTFETRKEGMAKYTGLLNAASGKKDYEQMLINVIRLLELQDSQLSPTGLRCYKEAALLLFKLGYEKAGDEAMHSCVELFKNSGMPLARDAALETFIIYAFNTKNAKKAEKMAEELLKTRPNHLPALTVQMVVHAEAKRLTEAKQIAKRIQSLDKNKQSMAYKTASHVLATDPNQQGPDK
ncbi:MAG: hypothetical protein IIB56_04340 [Planctomycetes bacterium]|nr:hypothetical protein [Planctomycetota bacterium]